MPNAGDSSELEKSRPDNKICLPVKTQISLKYNTFFLCMWFNVGVNVIEIQGNNSGMMWGANEQDICLVIIQLQKFMSQPVFNVLVTDLYLSCISLILGIDKKVDLCIICIALKRDVMGLDDLDYSDTLMCKHLQ